MALVLALALSACDLPGIAPDMGAAGTGGLRLSYEDVLAPQVYRREGPAVAAASDDAPGFWAETPGLPRPERGRVEHLASGATIDVALFAGRGGAIRLSSAAAEAIGIGPDPAQVRVTALRREPRIAGP